MQNHCSSTLKPISCSLHLNNQPEFWIYQLISRFLLGLQIVFFGNKQLYCCCFFVYFDFNWKLLPCGKINKKYSWKKLVDSEFRIGCWHVMKKIIMKCCRPVTSNTILRMEPNWNYIMKLNHLYSRARWGNQNCGTFQGSSASNWKTCQLYIWY